MTRTHLTFAATAVTLWTALGTPAFAADHSARARGEARGENRAATRQAPPNRAPRFAEPQRQARGLPYAPERREAIPRNAPPRFEQRGGPRWGYAQPRFIEPRAIAPRAAVRGPYYQPYYSFRPRVRLGFGLWAGYPVIYPSYDPYDYGPSYDYPNADPYPPAGASTYPVPAPGTVSPVATGGLSFDITPTDAAVYVDGQYAGAVGQFSPSDPPLSLAPGRHRVEISAQGYRATAFDVEILAGQVIPYQGAMVPQ